MLLVGHAAAQADDEAGLFFLEPFQRAHVAEHPLLSVLTHSAGIEQNQVSIFGLIAQAIADIYQHALDALAVVDVLLTAVAVHKGQRRGVVGLPHQLGGNGIMFKVNVFQKNHPSPPGRVAPCGETLFSAIL